MADIKKVMKGLECCKESTEDDPFQRCGDCPYGDISIFVQDCRAVLSEEALDILKTYQETIHNAAEFIKVQPEIVQCKDCIQRGTYQCPVYVGGDGMCSEPDYWFCADGRRREPHDG